MVVEEYALIQVSKSNKKRLDNLKLFERETYNLVIGELIGFGEEKDFKSIRIENLTKNLRNEKDVNAKTKIKQGTITASTG